MAAPGSTGLLATGSPEPEHSPLTEQAQAAPAARPPMAARTPPTVTTSLFATKGFAPPPNTPATDADPPRGGSATP